MSHIDRIKQNVIDKMQNKIYLQRIKIKNEVDTKEKGGKNKNETKIKKRNRHHTSSSNSNYSSVVNLSWNNDNVHDGR